MDKFVCDTCEKEYPTKYLALSFVPDRRYVRLRDLYFKCAYCAAENEVKDREYKEKIRRWTELGEKHPRIFNKYGGTDVLGNEVYFPAPNACGGVGWGWFDLVERLCNDVEKMLDESGGFCHFFQMKEKFGGLRLYVSAPTRAILNRINEAENESLKTCEICGNPGEPRGGGWIVTRCDEHAPNKKEEAVSDG